MNISGMKYKSKEVYKKGILKNTNKRCNQEIKIW